MRDDRSAGRRRNSRRRRLPAVFATGRHSAGRGTAAVPAALLQGSAARRLTEILMPASVIAAGVLLVVAFGFIILNRSGTDDGTTVSAVPPAPPALGTAPLAPTDQAVIPLPSPSPSRGPSASPTPPRRTTPAARNDISIARATVPATVDLSAQGSRDWVHWGQKGTFALERDDGGDFQILEGPPTATRVRHDASPQKFTWTGGSPVAESGGTTTGIHTCGPGKGFRLSVPAARSPRTLRLYLGAVAARGRLDAKLSTGGGTESVTFDQRDNDLATVQFVVTYRAVKDGDLTLNWVTEDSYDDDCGGVALQAATLR